MIAKCDLFEASTLGECEGLRSRVQKTSINREEVTGIIRSNVSTIITFIDSIVSHALLVNINLSYLLLEDSGLSFIVALKLFVISENCLLHIVFAPLYTLKVSESIPCHLLVSKREMIMLST